MVIVTKLQAMETVASYGDRILWRLRELTQM